MTKPDNVKRFGLLFFTHTSNSKLTRQLALIYIGLGSIISQIVLVREFLASFYGNELSIGIVFSSWLMWIGLGSIAGNIFTKNNLLTRRILSVLIAVSPAVTCLQLLSVKFVRLFFQSAAGSFLTIFDLLVSSFLILSFGCFLWGLLFSLGAKILTSEKNEVWLGVNKAYILESLGGVLGGLLFSFLLSSFLSTLQVVVLLFLIAWLVALISIDYKIKWIAPASIITISIPCLLLFQQIKNVEYFINQYQWNLLNDKLTFIKSLDTKYQNLSLLQLENQYSIFTNGKPAYNIPNIYNSEMFVHSIMVHNVDAANVLVIGGGFNGILNELLKYPSAKIEYLEIDSSLISFSENILTEHDRKAMHSERVTMLYADGRDFLRQTANLYDVIILNTGDPSTANQNRYFTLEFYQLCKLHLTSNGIIAFSLQSSAEYMANELKDLNASLYHTLKQVFGKILAIPGERAVLIGASAEKQLTTLPDSLAERFENTNIKCELFSKYMFWDLMQPERVQSATNLLESINDFRINTDSNPIVYYFDLLFWNRLLHDGSKVLAFITSSRIFISGIIITSILIILLYRLKQGNTKKRYALILIIFLGGLVGMTLNLLLIFNFQQSFGSIYEMVGMMAAGNIFGLAFGSLIISIILHKYPQRNILLIVVAMIIVEVLLTPIIFEILLSARYMPFTLFATVISGSLTGMLFGIVNRYYLNSSDKIGSIYSFDLFGSSVGALTTCSVLLPILGIKVMVFFMLMALLPMVIACFSLYKSDK